MPRRHTIQSHTVVLHVGSSAPSWRSAFRASGSGSAIEPNWVLILHYSAAAPDIWSGGDLRSAAEVVLAFRRFTSDRDGPESAPGHLGHERRIP